jgi:hypothetical protein
MRCLPQTLQAILPYSLGKGYDLHSSEYERAVAQEGVTNGARKDRPEGGIIYLSKPIVSTLFSLPDGVPAEKR